MVKKTEEKWSPFRERMHEVIFEADTKNGKLFDILLLIFILVSVLIVIIETVPSYQEKYGTIFTYLEWIFTAIFTLEYISRLYSVRKPLKYAGSFFGIVDLISILPSFLSFFLAGTHSLMVVRGLRLMRVFRIFKLGSFLKQGQVIITALKQSKSKIAVFIIFIMIIVSIFGALMYLIEGNANEGFDSIPRSIYWAIVTLTTVGYGDISPSTSFGQFIASVIMISGYAIIAVPTGIVTSEVIKSSANQKEDDEVSTQVCRYCSKEGHDKDAKFCKFCGELLNPE